MNPLKFGESFANGNAEPSLRNKEGVETRRGASRTDEGIVQTTNGNGSESYSSKKISRLMRAGSNPASGTIPGPLA